MLSILSHWLTTLKSFFAFDQLTTWVIVLSFITGLSFVFLVPPFQKADEIVHYYKSISVASGQLTCGKAGYTIPTYLHELPKKTRATYILSHPTAIFPLELYSLLWHEDTTYHQALEPASCTLPLLYYLPSGLVLLPLVNLSAPSLAIFFTGRLVNFLLAFGIALFALARLPTKFKWLGLVVLALPMTLFQFSSFNKDWATLSVGLLFFAELLRLKFSDKKHFKELIFIAMLSILVVLSRPTYFPILLLSLLYFSSAPLKHAFITAFNHHKLLVIFFLLFSLLGLLGFSYIFALPLWTKFQFLWHQPYVDEVDARLQLLHILSHPWQFVLTLWTTFEDNWYFYINSMIGILGWLDYGLPKLVYTFYYGIFLYVVFKLVPKVQVFSKKEILSFVLAVTLSVFLIFFSHYLFSSAVAASVVAGVQGRYFIPLLPFALLALSGTIFYWKKYLAIFVGVSIVLLILGVTTHRYYTNDNDYISHISGDQVLDVKNAKQTSLSKETFVTTKVAKDAYLVGLRIYLSDTQSKSLQPSVIRLYDGSCKLETWSKTIPTPEFVGKKYLDVQTPLVIGTKQPLCWSLSPFEKSLGVKTFLKLPLTTSSHLVATPLYLYRD